MNMFEGIDVVVCGAGHAGCEAALASARCGACTLLVTGNLDTIAKMSCNPAIGGLAKGNIVREIDALGGEMAVNADCSAIQFRLLNRSKGPAVQGPRAQCDKDYYSLRMKRLLIAGNEHLHLFQAIVTGLIVKDDHVVGVTTDVGVNIHCRAVVLTNGTFLHGLMHIGQNKMVGGRLGDFASKDLSDNLVHYGISLDRMKTGTPARIVGSSIDFGQCEEQPGDKDPCLFGFYDTRSDGKPSFFSRAFNGDIENTALLDQDFSNQKSCWMVHTTLETREIIMNNLSRSPLFSGEIVGIGPRYCPSIEDKYVKFPDHETHRLFLEPEGIFSDEWYINGLSSSLPFDVQDAAIHSIPALKYAKILRPAYAVEYDFAPPTQIMGTLESKVIGGLFCAGQINGTSGYEEAAGQGLVAGVNAAMSVQNKEMMVLGRQDAYIGVLIDDLVTKGTFEPYRMFTSRAEHRLLLNHNSADVRLLPFAEKFGLLSSDRLGRTREKWSAIQTWIDRLGQQKQEGKTFTEWLTQARAPETLTFPEHFYSLSPSTQSEIIYRIRYAGYLERERRAAKKSAELDHVRIPDDFCYDDVPSLSNESRQKLKKFLPQTLGQADRISGITPVDISLLLVHLEALHREKKPDDE